MLYFVILLVCLVGNILVVLVIYKNQQLRKSINFFVSKMAASDYVQPVVHRSYSNESGHFKVRFLEVSKSEDTGKHRVQVLLNLSE